MFENLVQIFIVDLFDFYNETFEIKILFACEHKRKFMFVYCVSAAQYPLNFFEHGHT